MLSLPIGSKARFIINKLLIITMVITLLLPINMGIARVEVASAAADELIYEDFDDYNPGTSILGTSGHSWSVMGTAPTMTATEDLTTERKYAALTHESGSSYLGRTFADQTKGLVFEFDINLPTNTGGVLFINSGKVNSTNTSAAQLEFNAGKLRKRNAATPFAEYDTEHWYRYQIFFNVPAKTYSLTIVDLTTDDIVTQTTEPFTNVNIERINAFGFALVNGGSINIDNLRVASAGIYPNLGNVTAEGRDSKVLLRWSEPSDPDYVEANIYQIDPENESLTFIESVDKGAEAATLTGLTNGVTYTYIIKAVYANDTESSGVIVSATPAVDPVTEGTILLDETFDDYSPGASILWSVAGTAPTMTAVEDAAAGRNYAALTHESGSSYIGRTFADQTEGLVFEFDINLPTNTGGLLFINSGKVNSTSTSAAHLEFNAGKLQKRNAATPFAEYDTEHWYRYQIFFNVPAKTYSLTIVDLTTDDIVTQTTEPFTNANIVRINAFGFALENGGSINIDNLRVTTVDVQLDDFMVIGGILKERFEPQVTDYTVAVAHSASTIQLMPMSNKSDILISVDEGELVAGGTPVTIDVTDPDITNIPVMVFSSRYPGIYKVYTFSITRLDAYQNPEDVRAEGRDSRVLIGWSEPPDPTYVKANIYLVNPADESLTLIQTAAKGTEVISLVGLVNGTTYTYVVKAVFADETESSGVSVSATPTLEPVAEGKVLLNETFNSYSPGTEIIAGEGNSWGVRGTAPTMTIMADGATARRYASLTHQSGGSSYLGRNFESQTGGLIFEFDINLPSNNGGLLFINSGNINSTTNSAAHLEFNAGKLQKRNAATPFATYDVGRWYHYSIFFSVPTKTYTLTIVDLTTELTVAQVTEPFTNINIERINSFSFAVNNGGTINIDNVRLTAADVQLDGLAVEGGTLSERFEHYWRDYTIIVPHATSTLQLTPTVIQSNTEISVNDGDPVASGVPITVDVSDQSLSHISVSVSSTQYAGISKTYQFEISRLEAYPNPEHVEVDAKEATVHLGWTEPLDPTYVKAHIYQVNAEDDSLELLRAVDKGSQMVTFSGLANGTTYTYVVKAVFADGTESTGVTIHATPIVHPARQMERLNRGLVAIHTDEGIYVGWRLLGTDPEDTAFNLYRDGVKLNSAPITDSTNYLDADGDLNSVYDIQAIMNGQEQTSVESVNVWNTNYLSIPIQQPEGGVTVAGEAYTYRSNEASVGDLDGDGEYEIIMKWSPTNQKDNGQSGHTGPTYIDAYKLDGTLLWRIDCGINIRSGSHYNHFLVYDLDGDGKAEVALKTADGTVDGLGNVIGDATKNYVNADGFILDGPEYLTVFRGIDGKALDTVEYTPGRGNVADWGDSYGNRVDRFLGAIAYLDGVHPSLVMTRGYYTRMTLTAYDFKNGKLTLRWAFDSDTPGNEAYYGQGNHQLSVADVDGDGKDEILTGAAAIDDDGTGLWSSGLGHGDALHVGDLDPNNPGLEVWAPQEDGSVKYSVDLKDAKTGRVIFGQLSTNTDTGRALTGDIDPRYPGEEMWAPDGSNPNVWEARRGRLYSATGELLSMTIPSTSFAIWWDGDLSRELLDHDFNLGGIAHVDKWDYENFKQDTLVRFEGFASTGTKGYPFIQADLFGDWREEVILKDVNATSEIRIYTTTDVTQHKIHTLMHDPQYRLAVASQNVAYNQPPHPSFYLGNGMTTPPRPNIYTLPEDVVSPTNLTAIASSASAIVLSWSSVENADSYNIYRLNAADDTYVKINDETITGTMYTDTGLTASTTYHYVITAIQSGMESASSAQVSATTLEGDAEPGDLAGKADLTGSSEVYAGQPLDLMVGLDNLTGSFTTLDVVLNYDPEKFAFDTVEHAGKTRLAEEVLTLNQSSLKVLGTAVKQDKGKLRIILNSTGGHVAEAGELFTLHGRVTDEAATGALHVSLSDFEVSLGMESALIDVTEAKLDIQVKLADKKALSGKIAEAWQLYSSTTGGNAPGQYPNSARQLFDDAIQVARDVEEDADATQAEVEAAVLALVAAIAAYQSSVNPATSVDIAELQAAITAAKARFSVAEAGEKIGQYPQEAITALEDAIDEADSVRRSGTASQHQVNQAVTALNQAVQTFTAQLITLVPGAGKITIRDLSIIAQYYNVTNTDERWSEIEKADVIGDGVINLQVLAAVAQMILDEWLLE